jgi:hypothetical protein
MRSLILIKNSTVHTNDSIEFQCKAKGHTQYDYELKIYADPHYLDDKDFIIDHVICHKVIEEVVQNKMGSCERLLLRMETNLLAALREHGAIVQRMELSIKPVSDPPSNAWVGFVSDYDVPKKEYKGLTWIREDNL